MTKNRQTGRFFERHVPYNTDLWKTLRGDMYATDYFEGLKEQRCFQETGAECKIAADLNSKSGYEFRRAEMSIRLVTQEGSGTLAKKGYFCNVESGGLLRQCDGLNFVLRNPPLG